MSIHAIRPGDIVDLVHGETWNRELLTREIGRRAAILARHGVGPGTVVAIAHGGHPSFYGDLLAAWRLGACAACLNPALAAPEIQNVCRFLEPAAVLVRGEERAGADLGAPVLDVGAAPDPGVGSDPATGSGSLDDPALILFTSGTTGEPKGVVHTFRSILARVALNRTYIGDQTLERTLCVLPGHFGHGLIGNGLTPLLAGKTLFLGGGIGLASAARLGETIDEHRITFMSSVPALWKLVLKVSGPPSKNSLRRVSIGSAPLSADLWHSVIEWTGTKNVANMYGITETANWLAGSSAAVREPEDGLIGTMWGGSFAVLGEDGAIRPDGEGEILVTSPSIMHGYRNREDLTREVMRDGWFLTGDIGRVDAEGVARLTGRKKHEINRAGMKIHPEDIDLLLERHPEVIEACAFGIEDEISGEIVGVAVRTVEDSGARDAEIRDWMVERVRRESIPERWFFVPEIPKTDRGKINRDNVRLHCLGEGAGR